MTKEEEEEKKREKKEKKQEEKKCEKNEGKATPTDLIKNLDTIHGLLIVPKLRLVLLGIKFALGIRIRLFVGQSLLFLFTLDLVHEVDRVRSIVERFTAYHARGVAVGVGIARRIRHRFGDGSGRDVGGGHGALDCDGCHG